MSSNITLEYFFLEIQHAVDPDDQFSWGGGCLFYLVVVKRLKETTVLVFEIGKCSSDPSFICSALCHHSLHFILLGSLFEWVPKSNW